MALICQCQQITEEQYREAITSLQNEGQATTCASVRKCLGKPFKCGACKPLLQDIITKQAMEATQTPCGNNCADCPNKKPTITSIPPAALSQHTMADFIISN